MDQIFSAIGGLGWVEVVGIIVVVAALVLLVWALRFLEFNLNDEVSSSEECLDEPIRPPRYLVHDECPTCKTGKLVHPPTDGLRTRSYQAEASSPYKLMCDHCGNHFDGFYIRGLQM